MHPENIFSYFFKSRVLLWSFGALFPSFWSGPLSHSRHPPRFVHSLETQSTAATSGRKLFCDLHFFASPRLQRSFPTGSSAAGLTSSRSHNDRSAPQFIFGEVSWTVPWWRWRACCYTFQDKSYDVFWRNLKTGETNKVQFCNWCCMSCLSLPGGVACWECPLCLADLAACQMTFAFSQTHAASVCFHTNRRIGKSQCLSVHFWSSF